MQPRLAAAFAAHLSNLAHSATHAYVAWGKLRPSSVGCPAASHFIHFGCIAHTFSHAKRNCNRARVKGPTRHQDVPPPATPASPTGQLNAQSFVLHAGLAGSLKLNLSTLTRTGWGAKLAVWRKCETNDSDENSELQLCRCLYLCLSLPLSLFLSIPLPPSHPVHVLPKMQLFHCHNCQPALQLQLQLAIAHCSLALLLLLPLLQLLPLLGRQRKPEVVNIHAKTQPAFNVLASAPYSPLQSPSTNSLAAPATALGPAGCRSYVMKNQSMKMLAKNTFVTVWKSAHWQRGKLVVSTARTQYKDRNLGAIAEGSGKIKGRRSRRKINNGK